MQAPGVLRIDRQDIAVATLGLGKPAGSVMADGDGESFGNSGHRGSGTKFTALLPTAPFEGAAARAAAHPRRSQPHWYSAKRSSAPICAAYSAINRPLPPIRGGRISLN